MFLVILVMFVFLQSWRATVIPAMAIPVVLLGTFGVLAAFGFSINTMTLFGLVLAVGLLVDDAIVVVENIERILEERPELSPARPPSSRWSEIQMALIAIALVLSAVFLPMMFFGGSTGVIYRQFSATIVSAMVLSVFIALTLSPSLAANVLRRRRGNVETNWLRRKAPAVAHSIERGRVKFNKGFQRLIDWYVEHVGGGRSQMAVPRHFCRRVRGPRPAVRAPSDRLHADGRPGRGDRFSIACRQAQHWAAPVDVQLAVENYFLKGPEKKNVGQYFTVAGGGQGLSGQNTGQAFISLADLDQRTGKREQRRRDRQARFRCIPRASRCSGLRADPAARSAGLASRAVSRWRCRTPAA